MNGPGLQIRKASTVANALGYAHEIDAKAQTLIFSEATPLTDNPDETDTYVWDPINSKPDLQRLCDHCEIGYSRIARGPQMVIQVICLNPDKPEIDEDYYVDENCTYEELVDVTLDMAISISALRHLERHDQLKLRLMVWGEFLTEVETLLEQNETPNIKAVHFDMGRVPMPNVFIVQAGDDDSVVRQNDRFACDIAVDQKAGGTDQFSSLHLIMDRSQLIDVFREVVKNNHSAVTFGLPVIDNFLGEDMETVVAYVTEQWETFIDEQKEDLERQETPTVH